MTRRLRSNFDEGTTLWALRKAQWTALGFSDAEMARPKIAIINASSELSSCYSHLDGLCAEVKKGIGVAGGIAFEIKTTAPSDFIHCAGRDGRYILPARDLMVNDIEVTVEGPQLDGMVCLASCDKTAPAQLMAAARLNIPTILVIGGYQASGRVGDRTVDIEDVFEGVGRLGTRERDLSFSDLDAMCLAAVAGPGVCAGMGTANSMHMMSEALGMTLPGSAPIAANAPRTLDLARAAGRRIVSMVLDDIRPSSVLTPEAFHNAVCVALAVCTSINVMRHLQAVAEEGEVDVDVYELFEQLGPRVPLLCAIRPNGPGRIEELDAAGGTAAIMKRLESLLHTTTTTVEGGTIADRLEGIASDASSLLGTVDQPVSPGPSLIIMRGTLAPDGAIMKLGSGEAVDLRFQGPAKVFESQPDALMALREGRLAPGDVVILRGLGAKGGPGVASASWFAAALSGTELAGRVAMITDGQLSGLNHGTVVGQVMPEAAQGGPLAAVRDGDPILIDVPERLVNIEIPDSELARRLDDHPPTYTVERRGWLAIYQRLVSSLQRGGVLSPVEAAEGTTTKRSNA